MKRASAIKSSDPDTITSFRYSGIESDMDIGKFRVTPSSPHQTSYDFRQLGEIDHINTTPMNSMSYNNSLSEDEGEEIMLDPN
jgi:hypothetical protein